MRGEPVGDVKKEEMESNGFFGVLSDGARPEVSFGRSVEPVKVLNQATSLDEVSRVDRVLHHSSEEGREVESSKLRLKTNRRGVQMLGELESSSSLLPSCPVD